MVKDIFRKFAPWVLTLPLLIFCGCALMGGESDLVRSDDYTIQPPAGWKVLDRGASDRAYLLPSKNVATVTSSCKRDATVPLELLTKHLLIGARHINYVEQKRISVDGVEGLFSRVRATYEGNKSFLVLFVIPKDGCVFDFTLISNKVVPDGDIDSFLNFVKTFHYAKS